MQIKKRIYITIGLLSGLTLAALALAAIPSILAIKDLQSKIGAEQAKINEQYALRLYVRNSLSNLPETTKKISSLSAAVLKEGKELEFITALESAAKTTGVKQEISLETVNQKDTSKWEREIPLKLRITGQYEQVVRHVNAIEHLPYYVAINSIDLSPPRTGDASKDGTVDAVIHGVVNWQGISAPSFVRGEEEPPPSVPQ